jgi:hypothetical protein
VCDGDDLASRLRDRPAWRGFDNQERIAEMLEFNEWLRSNAPLTSPPMTLLDTTDITPAQTVAAVARWVRTQLSS